MEMPAASKKMIAIWHYSGDFDNLLDDGSVNYIGGEAYAVAVDENMQFSGFKQEIAETIHCDSTVLDTMIIKYLLPGNNKNLITVSSDKEFKHMLNQYKEAAAPHHQLQVFIMKKQQQPALASAPPTRPQAVDLDVDSSSAPLAAAKQWENAITGVRQTFQGMDEFREALRKYSIAHGFSYELKKNENQRVTAKCKAQGCPWRIHCSKVSTTHQLVSIKTMRPHHTCSRGAVTTTVRWQPGLVANLIQEKFKETPKIKPKDIATQLERDYGVHLSYGQARRARKARQQLLGSDTDAYNPLSSFCEKIMETNPGSVARYTTKEDLSSFGGLFVCFGASISGFLRGCRPLLFLDSTPWYPGRKLLTATAADGDDSPFPVAFAVVEEGFDDNWHCFLTQLKTMVVGAPITFVADFQKGIRESLQEIFTAAESCHHAYCLRYLTEKLKKDLTGLSNEARGLVVEYLSAAAQAPKLEDFNKLCTQDILAIAPEAYNWVMGSEPQHWANALFGGFRFNHMTSDFGKDFWVLEPNQLPITQMVDELRGRMMRLIDTRRDESALWLTPLTPSMEEKLNVEMNKAEWLQILRGTDHVFQVASYYSDAEIVDIKNWDCSCKGWLITGLPCPHAIRVLLQEQGYQQIYDHCSLYFHVDMYHKTYEESILPIDEALVPPPTTIKRQTCSKCKQQGHNKRSCKNSI